MTSDLTKAHSSCNLKNQTMDSMGSAKYGSSCISQNSFTVGTRMSLSKFDIANAPVFQHIFTKNQGKIDMSLEAFLGSYPHLGVVVRVAGSSEICSAIANRMHCTVTCCLISVYRKLELIIQHYCLIHMTVGNSQQEAKVCTCP